MRNNRPYDSLRNIKIEKDIQPQADGSILIKMGNTHIICGVTIEEKVPSFLEGRGQGWITAEYGMLPCATNSRYRREHHGQSGRTMEIQRLIGRSLRMMVDLQKLGERTLRVDCDVLNADGGTRTASITGGALAVQDALEKLVEENKLEANPMSYPVAAISAGIVNGEMLLDLNYSEDSAAEVDGNFVMTKEGEWIEVQVTAEEKPVTSDQVKELTALAQKGIEELFCYWK